MLSIYDLSLFFGWCSAINIVILTFSTLMLTTCSSVIRRIHERLLGLGEEDLKRLYVNYLAGYKALILVFNIIPWLALQCMLP
ncbi:MAG: hypothetical protein OXT67_13990 [Zetaproteobacteria bacterium]|nr:hypothetical protein [Zetaproteobacteria bacterium]